ncbi:hypothetical protein ACH50O_23465 (plasmid) [Methylomonas sp. 2BW1-5-20]|uniref:hypothetical protein n=1 Tax=Methylomonas sp. 2BW1-5-20 TaxID=3376686 RepID=UPI00404CF7C3
MNIKTSIGLSQSRCEPNIDPSINKSRRIFILNSVVILSGCATKTTKECLMISSEDQMDCLYDSMFPNVVAGVIAGAVLGGVIAFATHNHAGLFVAIGGIVGGVSAGALTYYNFINEKVDNNSIRGMEFVYQDCRSDLNKFQRMSKCSRDEMLQYVSRLEQGRLNQFELDLLTDHQNKRLATIKNGEEYKELVQEVVLKLSKIDISLGHLAKDNDQLKGMNNPQRSLLKKADDISEKLFLISKSVEDLKRDNNEINKRLIMMKS